MESLKDQFHKDTINSKNLRYFKNKNKGNTAQLQEVLRQRCRQRMKEKRNQLACQIRMGFMDSSREIQEKLTEIVQNEFNNLTTVEVEDSPSVMKPTIDDQLEENEALEIQNEIIDEEEQRIIKEYEEMMDSEEKHYTMLPEDEYVICPMCHKFGLYEIPDFIICKICGLKLRTNISLLELKQNIDQNLEKHSKQCDRVPVFSLFCDMDILICISCKTCSSLSIIDMLPW